VKAKVICQLCDFAPLVPGSFVDSMLRLASYCREQANMETIFIFPEPARERFWIQRFEELQFKCVFVPRKRNVVDDIRKHLENYDPLIFHTHFFRFDLCAIWLKLFYYRKSKVIWHYHSRQTDKWLARIKDLAKLGIIGRCLVSATIAVGDAISVGLLNAGMPADRVILIYNGIDATRFIPSKSNRQHVRKLFDIPEASTVFLLLGRHPVIKGLDVFVKAAEKATRIFGYDLVFLIVGKDETKKAVSLISQEMGQLKTVHVIDPFEDFSSLLSGVDVFVSSSRTEGAPYAILEAMAGRKIIISSDIPIPAIHGSYGRSNGILVYPTEDWNALCNLIGYCQRLDLKTRNDLGKTNREEVEMHFSVKKWIEKIQEHYGVF